MWIHQANGQVRYRCNCGENDIFASTSCCGVLVDANCPKASRELVTLALVEAARLVSESFLNDGLGSSCRSADGETYGLTVCWLAFY